MEFGFSGVRVIPDADLIEETVALPDGRVINIHATTSG
jgi:hypothetical protein